MAGMLHIKLHAPVLGFLHSMQYMDLELNLNHFKFNINSTLNSDVSFNDGEPKHMDDTTHTESAANCRK